MSRLHQHDCPWCSYRSTPAREATSRWNMEYHARRTHPERYRADLLYRVAIFRGRTPEQARRVYDRAVRFWPGKGVPAY